MSTEINPGEKTAHLALPLRWSLLGQANRGAADTACTYDVDSKGARLVSSRAPRLGDLLMLERGRNFEHIGFSECAGDPANLRRALLFGKQMERGCGRRRTTGQPNPR